MLRQEIFHDGLFGSAVDLDAGVQFRQEGGGKADEEGQTLAAHLHDDSALIATDSIVSVTSSGTISVAVLQLGVVRLPDWHPRAADGTCVIQAYAVRHPDGVILFDTGVGDDHPMINELFDPTVVPVIDALGAAGIDERDVTAIVNSHLHFDHCGQNHRFPTVPVYAQHAEYELVETPMFTVPEWARVTPDRLRLIDGDADLADGVRLLATPGHTPGHQSLVVDDGEQTTVIAGQCCYTCVEFAANEPAVADVHDESWLDAARDSITHLQSFGAAMVHLSHDPNVIRRPR